MTMRSNDTWQLTAPIHAIVFDCDGTLSAIEGIDELAKQNNVGEQVESLTKQAMDNLGMNPELYRKRLDLVLPHQEQVLKLGQDYFKNQVPDVAAVIQILKRLEKEVYVVSAGLNPAVKIFGELLAVPRQNIFAVDLRFDATGRYADFDAGSPLVYRHGKREVTAELAKQHARILHIGDGMNDFVVADAVTRFVGYGGVFYRETIASQCDFYIKSLSLAALLPLVLTAGEAQQLLPSEMALYEVGLEAIKHKKVQLPTEL